MIIRFYFILSIAFNCICSLVEAQTDTLIYLNSNLLSSPPKGLTIVRELSLYSSIDKTNKNIRKEFKNIPNDLIEGIIKFVHFSKEEEGVSSECTVQNQLKNQHVKDSVFFMIGTNFKRKRVIIVDANNNKDFGDDRLFELDSARDNKKRIVVTVNTECCYNKTIYNKEIPLYIIPFDNYKGYDNEIENKFSISLFAREFKIGKIKLYNDSVIIKLSFPTSYLIDDTSSWKIDCKFIGKPEYLQPKVQYNLGDTIQLMTKFYVINATSPFANIIRLTELHGKESLQGIDIGSMAIPISGIDFISGKLVNSSSYKSKYVLIDFWGSWCAPCLSSIPKLVKLSNDFKNNLQIVSIAVDEEKRLTNLKKIILNNKMNWIHLIETSNSKDTYNVKYRITAFPHYILIDPAGKVVKRIDDGNLKSIYELIL